MIIKDEADILVQTLQSLIAFGGFSRIFIFDNGSADDTFQLAQQYCCDSIKVSMLEEQFSDNLKFENVYRHKNILADGDWFAILDADEIYQEPLLPLIKLAEAEQANYIESRSAQFYFTEQESNYEFDPAIPAVQQHPYYLLNYGEPRIFRYSENFLVTAENVKKRHPTLVPCSRQLLIHHCQFRSAKQLQRRLDIRLANNSHSKNWGHINSASWKDYIVPARYLHKFDGDTKTGLPLNSNLYKIRNNAAYTMANLNWLRKHHYLNEEQLEFFGATRFQRLIRRLW